MHFAIQYQFDVSWIAQKHYHFVAEKSSAHMAIYIPQSQRFFDDF